MLTIFLTYIEFIFILLFALFENIEESKEMLCHFFQWIPIFDVNL